MARRTTTLTLRIQVGTITRRWCDQCMSLTGYTAHLARITDDGVTTMGDVSGCAQEDDHD